MRLELNCTQLGDDQCSTGQRDSLQETARALWQAKAGYRHALSKVLTSDLMVRMSASTPKQRRQDLQSRIEETASRPAV